MSTCNDEARHSPMQDFTDVDIERAIQKMAKKLEEDETTVNNFLEPPRFIAKDGEARKDDAEKPRLDLLPVDPLIEVGKILTFGAQKYRAYNWCGLNVSRCYAATLRHLFAWWNGEDKDEETGLSPIDHAICELMFISWILKHRPEQDDRRINDDKSSN